MLLLDKVAKKFEKERKQIKILWCLISIVAPLAASIYIGHLNECAEGGYAFLCALGAVIDSLSILGMGFGIINGVVFHEKGLDRKLGYIAGLTFPALFYLYLIYNLTLNTQYDLQWLGSFDLLFPLRYAVPYGIFFIPTALILYQRYHRLPALSGVE